MVLDGVEVVEVLLLVVDDLFEELDADGIPVVAADQQELVVGVDGVVFLVGIKGEDGLDVLSLCDRARQLRGRLAAHVDIAFGRRVGGVGDVDEAEFEMMSLRAESFFAQLRRLERAFRTARSDVDPLTGTYNRQTMLGDLSNERERSVRTDTPTAIALVDLDHFKLVNDTYGHQSGDLVLQSVAGILQSHVRPFDKVYRYGGEEFLICLPNADMKQCARVLERLRRVIEASPVTLTDGSILPVTASIGAAPMTKTRTIEQIIEKADQALYAAKEGGRNKIRVWRNPDSNKAVKSDNDTPKA